MYSLFCSFYVALCTDRIAIVNLKNPKIHLIFNWSFLSIQFHLSLHPKLIGKFNVFFIHTICFSNFNTVFIVFSLRMPVSHYIKKSDALNPLSEKKNADYTLIF